MVHIAFGLGLQGEGEGEGEGEGHSPLVEPSSWHAASALHSLP